MRIERIEPENVPWPCTTSSERTRSLAARLALAGMVVLAVWWAAGRLVPVVAGWIVG
jgi:hypothetical protein